MPRLNRIEHVSASIALGSRTVWRVPSSKEGPRCHQPTVDALNRRPVFGARVRLFRLRFVFHRRAETCLADTSVEPTSVARVSPRSHTSSHAASGVLTPAVSCASPHLASSSRAAAPCSRARVYPGKKGCGGFFFLRAARRVALLSSPAVGVSVGDEQHRDAAAAMAMTKSAKTAAETTTVTHRGRDMRRWRRFVAAGGGVVVALRGASSLVGRSEIFVTAENRRFVTRRFS